MPRVDRTKWEDNLSARASTTLRSRVPELQGIKRAGISAANIIGDKHWDFLLTIVQERIDSLQKQMETALDPLKNSDIFNVEAIITLSINCSKPCC